MLAGSSVGPAVTCRLPGTLLRIIVAATGVGLTVWLWVNSS
ncbi:MAG: hypothetical protein ACRDYB_16845 [Acidimicrobiales bacterium]